MATNAFLAHLGAWGYSPATVRAYACDIANLAEPEQNLISEVPSNSVLGLAGVLVYGGVVVGLAWFR